MRVTFHTIDDLDTPAPAPAYVPSRLTRTNRVLGFWLSYSACIVGIAILLSEVVLATGGNLAGRNVVLVGTVLLGLAIGGVVVSLVRAWKEA
jgi:hypothetical protein